jgi:hypothetical protein
VGRLAALVLLAGAAALAGAARADESSDCLVCHSAQRLAERGPGGQARSLFVDPASYYGSAHGKQNCSACHGALGVGPHGAAEAGAPAVPQPYAAFLVGRPAARQVAVANCMKCHPKEFQQYQASIHAAACAGGDTAAPLCDDCHGQHAIRGSEDLESSVSTAQVPSTCARCHADAEVMARRDIKTNVVQTFESHFHARKRELGDTRAAVCTSCHGVHEIRAPEDPASSVNPANAAHTCGQPGCHPGASPEFAASFSHRVPTMHVEPLVYLLTHVHHYMLYLVLSVMFIHIILDMLRRRLNGEPGLLGGARGGH